MTPDVEDLIKRINTLTLDKNRLKQRLTQLTNDQNGKDAIKRLNKLSLISQQSNPLESSTDVHNLSLQSNSDSSNSNSFEQSPPISHGSPTANGVEAGRSKLASNIVAGIECLTSCEDDLLYINKILRKRVDDYNENWDFIQSKCSTLLSELNALQVHYGRLKGEKLDLEERYKKKCSECDDIKSELQTVVINYESQLSAMSEHLSAITSHQIN